MATEAEWIKRIERWKRSGLEAADFAQREGLKPEELTMWCQKLDALPVAFDEPHSLPVSEVAPPSSAASSTAPAAPAWIEIALPNRALLRVLPGVDPGTLACMLAVAAELSVRDTATAQPLIAAQGRHGTAKRRQR